MADSRFHTVFAYLKKIKKIKKAEQSFDHPAFFKKSIILSLHMEHIRPLWFP